MPFTIQDILTLKVWRWRVWGFLLFLIFRCILKEKRGNGMTIFLSIFCSSVVCFILMKWHIANIEQRLNEQSQKEEAILIELTNRLSKNFDQTV